MQVEITKSKKKDKINKKYNEIDIETSKIQVCLEDQLHLKNEESSREGS